MVIPECLYDKINGFKVNVYGTKQYVDFKLPQKVYKITLYGDMLIINRRTDIGHIFNTDIYVIPNNMVKYINRFLSLKKLNV